MPLELESICSDSDETRLQLVIRAQNELDYKQLDSRCSLSASTLTSHCLPAICTRIHYDLKAFENNDRPVYDVSTCLIWCRPELHSMFSSSQIIIR